MPANIDFLLERYEKMKTLRSPFDRDLLDIRDLVRPITVAFNNITGQYNMTRPETLYDGTAPQALEDLAGALSSYLTNPAERWFEIQLEGDYAATRDPDTLAWLEQVTEIIYNQYRNENVNINATLHECYLDIGGFGTTCAYQEWNQKLDCLSFSSKPLAQCFFMEDNTGRIDTVTRIMTWTVRQIKQEFGEVLPKKLMEIKDQDRPMEVLHFVFPRTDKIRGRVDGANKPFASVWVCLTTQEVLFESGYDSFPYHVGRWTKLAGEIYGRGPAKKCLPDIKMLNQMEKTLLKAGQKQVDPPLVLRNEGFLLPIKTAPGSLIYKEDEEAQITPLRFEGNLPWGEEKANQKRAFIEKCFCADWIRMEKENVEMTAYEVQDRRDEKLRMLAPMLGRMVNELHSPMIARSYFLLNQHNKIPPSPQMLQGRKLRVGYLSPASRAQTGAKATLISRHLQDLLPFAQTNPEILDSINIDGVARELALARGIPRSVIRSEEEVAQLRDSRKQMQQMQQVAGIAEPASKAIKNLADAQAQGGGM